MGESQARWGPASRWWASQGAEETKGTGACYSAPGRRLLQVCLCESLGTEQFNFPIQNTGSVLTLLAWLDKTADV